MLAQAHLIDERYALVRSLGGGGFAEVWLANDVQLDRQVALKLPRGQRSALAAGAPPPPSREFELAARLEHPHIVRVLGTGESNAEPYLVLEYVDGPSLRERLEQSGPLSMSEVERLAGELTSALGHAHSRGILHNDIKPENILLGPSGAKLTDFGAAAGLLTTVTTAPGDFAATIAYLPPEVLQGDKPQPNSDIYALALVLYEAASGRLPWTGSSAAAIAGQRVAARAPELTTFVPNAPAALTEALDRALWLHPDGRFQNAEDFALALRGTEPTVVLRRSVPAQNKNAVAAVALPVAVAGDSAASDAGTDTGGAGPHQPAAGSGARSKMRRMPSWLPVAGMLGGGLAAVIGLGGLIGTGNGQLNSFGAGREATSTPDVQLVAEQVTESVPTATLVPPSEVPPTVAPLAPTQRPVIIGPGRSNDSNKDKPKDRGNDDDN